MCAIPGRGWGHVAHRHTCCGEWQKWPPFHTPSCIHTLLRCHFAGFPRGTWNLFTHAWNLSHFVQKEKSTSHASHLALKIFPGQPAGGRQLRGSVSPIVPAESQLPLPDQCHLADHVRQPSQDQKLLSRAQPELLTRRNYKRLWFSASKF